jgi:hypothetical protein
MLGQYSDIAVADGQPPQNKPGNPKSYKYLLAHRNGNDGTLKSQFTAVIEPYMDMSSIISVEAAEIKCDGKPVSDEAAAAVKVTLKDGRTDYIINSLDGSAILEVDGKIRFSGFLGVCTIKNNEPAYAYVNDGTLLEYAGRKLVECGYGALKGRVADFTRGLSMRNQILVELENADDTIDWTEKYVYIKNDGVRNASYRLESVQKTADGKYMLDIGDVTLIRKIADTKDLSKGYVYDVEVGGEVELPVTKIWRDS